MGLNNRREDDLFTLLFRKRVESLFKVGHTFYFKSDLHLELCGFPSLKLVSGEAGDGMALERTTDSTTDARRIAPTVRNQHGGSPEGGYPLAQHFALRK